MRQHSGPEVQIKASGGVRTLDNLLHMMSIGVHPYRGHGDYCDFG